MSTGPLYAGAVSRKLGRCSNSACTITQCQAGWADCNGVAADGCEVNTTNDPNHCAGCGKACSRNHDTPACTNSACVLSCDAGWQSCDGDLTNGCETSTASDAANCGGCGTACSNTGITPLCVGGNCVGACAPGFTDCNNDKRADGCEVQTATDKNNCGGCGTVCPSQNATASCNNAACAITCNAGFKDCDGSLANGCEVAVNTDANNCGACGTRCSGNNVPTPACTGGVCTGACAVNFADCNGNKQFDGCEVNIGTDANNCGMCNNSCAAKNVVSCVAGACTGACLPGYADCDSNKITNGCEVNLQSDSNNCGICGTKCVAPATCQNGACK